jgi:hypothetical protein
MASSSCNKLMWLGEAKSLNYIHRWISRPGRNRKLRMETIPHTAGVGLARWPTLKRRAPRNDAIAQGRLQQGRSYPWCSNFIAQKARYFGVTQQGLGPGRTVTGTGSKDTCLTNSQPGPAHHLRLLRFPHSLPWLFRTLLVVD